MSQNVEMRVISKSKATNGTPIKSRSEQTTYTKNIQKSSAQYVFIYGKGNKRVSETRHMTEVQANSYKSKLESL